MPTILILGATSDIGYAIAKKFASEGFNIQMAGRNAERLTHLQSDLKKKYTVACTTHAFDARDFSLHASFYESLSPKPDITVYVIGYMAANEKAIGDWNETLPTIQANYCGAVSILNIVGADYSKKGTGTIIGISSVAGNRGRQSNYIYGSAKAGFTAYLSGLRNRLYHYGVDVITVLPGFVHTKMTEHLDLPKLLTAEPEDVANAIYRAVRRKKNVLYVKWFWRYIMLCIGLIPEGVFKKRKL